MKNSMIIFTLFILSISINAQSYDCMGDQKFNIGYDFYGYGSGVKATYDYGLGSLFSIGAGVSYYFNNDENDYFLYGRTNFHLADLLDLPRQLDIYPGVEIGYLSSNDIGISGYVGLRYFFSKRLGVFAEIGTNGAIGLSIDL